MPADSSRDDTSPDSESPSPETRLSASPDQPPSSRYKHNRARKTDRNLEVAEYKSRTALVLGGGAPNMALMAGALAAFEDRGVTFDVVSTSGAGGFIGLLWLAPKYLKPAEALRNVVNFSVSDEIYNFFPVNYKIFNRPGALADAWRRWLARQPGYQRIVQQYRQSRAQKLMSDWLQLLWTWATPGFEPNPASWGLCAPLPFVDAAVDFSRVKYIEPYFYLNAYNITRHRMDDFPKEVITADHFRAALAFPFIYGPYRLGTDLYYEGAVVDTLNFKDLVEKHPGLETIVVFDVIGSDKLIRAPRNLLDSWALSIIVPLVETAKDDIRTFAWKHNKGWRREHGAKADLLKVTFDIPDEHRDKVLDWSRSNAELLFRIGYDAGREFYRKYEKDLTSTRQPAGTPAPVT